MHSNASVVRSLHGPEPGPRPIPGSGWRIRDDFSYGPGRQMKDDFSNGPGRAGKKRNEFFNGRVWLQKKEE